MRTSRGIEHLSVTVADLDEATAFFVEVFGCRVLYTMGPFDGSGGPFMRIHANADVRSVVHHVRVLRSPFLNIELFDASSPRRRPLWPDLFDVGGWCLTGTVDDLDVAIEYLTAKDVHVLGEVIRNDTVACHCMTSWGFHFELATDIGAPGAWNPARPDGGVGPGFPAGPGAIPGFTGFERVCVTVADVDEASALFVDVLGFEVLGDIAPPASADHGELRAVANVDARATPSLGRLLRLSYLNLELLECPPYPGQNAVWPAMFDVGGWHLAFYVDDIDAAVEDLAAADVHLLGPKKPTYFYEAGDEAYTVHCLAPFGLLFELVTYPHGRDDEHRYAGPAWHPGHPSRAGHPGHPEHAGEPGHLAHRGHPDAVT